MALSKMKARSTRCWVVQLLLVQVTIITAASLRLEAEDVDAIVSRGIALRRAGHDHDALVEFQRAMDIHNSPRVQVQVALAQQALGLWVQAERNLLEAMSGAGDPWIKKNALTLRKALATIQSHLGSLEVWGTPEGAEILIDQTPVGRLPLTEPLRVAGDSVVLTVRSNGYIEATRTVRVSSGESVREHVALTPKPAPVATNAPRLRPMAGADDPTRSPRSRAAEDAQGASDATGAATKNDTSIADDARGAHRTRRVLAWTTAGIAGLALAFGAVETVAALGKWREFQDHVAPSPDDPGKLVADCYTANLNDACRPIQTSYNRSVRLAEIGYGAAAAVGIGSAVLFGLSASDKDQPSSSAFACTPDVFSPGVACRLYF